MNIPEKISQELKSIIKEAYGIDDIEVSIQQPQQDSFGDYTTNIAFILGKKLSKNPKDISEELTQEFYSRSIKETNEYGDYPVFDKIEAVSSGYVNFYLSPTFLLNILSNICRLKSSYGSGDMYANQKVLFEYTDPNIFKLFHIGHLMSNCIGESLSRIYAFQGCDLRRVDYQGDVGMHVAKSIWGVFNHPETKFSSILKKSLPEKIKYLGKAYSLGATKYKEDEGAKKEMEEINCQVFLIAQQRLEKEEGWKPQVNYEQFLPKDTTYSLKLVEDIYLKGRQWSLDYFETVYKRLGTKFDGYYFESKSGEIGYKKVQEGLKDGIFEKSEGATVFRGEKYGLHTRVFINSKSLPTYEAKELGLAELKHEDFPYDKSFVITANEINDYFKVLFKAMEFVMPGYALKNTHFGHGVMKFATGKMSSRTGNIIGGAELLDKVKEAVLETMGVEKFLDTEKREETAEKIAVGSVKYSILKYQIGNDIIYDEEKSLALVGNTGPYLQYAYARTNSVLEKGGIVKDDFKFDLSLVQALSLRLNEKEQLVLKALNNFPQATTDAAQKFSPHVVADYLFDLAQKFNSFYNECSILDAESEDTKALRLGITIATSYVIETGLGLLGIEVVEKM